MTFLGSAFLLAIPLLAIPLAIHMMKKRRRDVVPWGAMQFLREPSRRGQRLSQMDRWLLLAARTLILICLIGALAQPIVRWSSADTASGLPMQIVMIDDTRSTLATADNQSTLFESIQARAIELVECLPEGTFIQVWAAGNPSRLIASTHDPSGSAGTHEALQDDLRLIDRGSSRAVSHPRGTMMLSKDEVVRAIESFTPRGGDGDFSAAIRQAVTAATRVQTEKGSPILGDVKNRSLDVWWFGDRSIAGWQQPLITSAMIPGDHQRLHLITASSLASNGYQLSVETLRSSRRAIAKNETIQLTASIVNHGAAESPAVTGQWKLNGKTFAQSDVPSLPPQAAGVAQTEVAIAGAGTHEITFALTTPTQDRIDQLAADNRRSMVVQVIGELPLLVIETPELSLGDSTTPDFAKAPRDSDYLSAALGRNLGGWKNTDSLDEDSAAAGTSLFRCDVRGPDELAKIHWNSYPAIAWIGGSPLPNKIVDQIVRRVRQGTGLWITLDATTDRAWLNETLVRTGLGSPTDRVGEGPVGSLVVNASEDSMQRLHPPDPTDEVLGPLSDTDRLDLDVVRIRRRIELQMPTTFTASASRVLLRTFNGDTVASLSSLGRGRVVVQGLPMNPSWSNFPLSKAYVVWVLQILDHVSQPVAENFNLLTGQMFRSRVESIDHEYEIEGPGKTINKVYPLPQSSSLSTSSTRHGEMGIPESSAISGVVRFDQTDRPGVYRLSDRDAPDIPPVLFAVVASPDESNLSSDVIPLFHGMTASDDGAARVTVLDGSGSIDFPEKVASLPNDVSGVSSGKPLWPVFLLGLLIAIATETFMAGYAALRRYGRLTGGPARSTDGTDSGIGNPSSPSSVVSTSEALV